MESSVGAGFSLCDSSSEMERSAGMGLESAPLSSSEMQPQDLVLMADTVGG